MPAKMHIPLLANEFSHIRPQLQLLQHCIEIVLSALHKHHRLFLDSVREWPVYGLYANCGSFIRRTEEFEHTQTCFEEVRVMQRRILALDKESFENVSHLLLALSQYAEAIIEVNLNMFPHALYWQRHIAVNFRIVFLIVSGYIGILGDKKSIKWRISR